MALSLLLGGGPVQGQVPRVESEVDTTKVNVGDRITLTVSVIHGPESQVVWPDSLDLAPFEVLQARELPSSTREGINRSSVALSLAAFELGDLEIPSFQMEVVGPDGESTILTTDRFGIQVTSVGLDEGGDIRDVKGPLGIPRSLTTLFLLLLPVVLALAVAFALYRWAKHRKSGTLGAPTTTPYRPPHEIALEALARLESSHLLDRGQVKEFYIRASEILRTFVEGRFGIPALEMTTRDLMSALEETDKEPLALQGFRSFLDRCDMVKFAKHRPDPRMGLELLDMGRRLVEESIPAPPPGPGGDQDHPGVARGKGNAQQEASAGRVAT
jgi:hypothetical protein